MGALLRAGLRDTRASSAIEFAILAPVFLLMLTGMMAYAIYFGAANSVQQLTADAARTAIAGLDAGERGRMVDAFLKKNAGDYMLIDQARVTWDVSDKANDPNQYLVTVHYDATELPIWNLYLPLPLPSALISYTSVIRRGGL